MANWPQLPYEIQVSNLNIVLCSLRDPTSGSAVGRQLKRTHDLLFKYALVSKTWCEYIEERMLRRLFVTQDSLHHVERLSRRQRKLVRYIWLKVDLASYNCPSCVIIDLDITTSRLMQEKQDSDILKAAVKTLFDILSTWDDCDTTEAGLTLEISAFSPSDAEQHDIKSGQHINTNNAHKTTYCRQTASSWAALVLVISSEAEIMAGSTLPSQRLAIGEPGWLAGSRS